MFTVLYGEGCLECVEYQETVALQFAESVMALSPQVDLVLLKNVDPKVLYSLGSEFMVCETKFGCVGTKGTLSHCTENQANLCRFNIDNWATVTFAYYDSLFALEKDLPVLCQPPFYVAHLFCVVIRRTVNWKTMVYKCSRALQIQYPKYPAAQCTEQEDIVLLGWQRYASCSTASLQIHKALPLTVPLVVSTCPDSRNVKTFNSKPVYVATYTRRQPTQHRNNAKKCRKKLAPPCTAAVTEVPCATTVEKVQQAVVAAVVAPFTGAVVAPEAVQVEETKAAAPPLFEKKQEPEVLEDWVLTAVYIDE